MFVYTEPMNTNMNEHTSYDVVLLPTYAEALSYRKRVTAGAGPRALFGVTVATFPAWIADLWELFGDGRVIASPLEVEALSVSLCSKDSAAAGCARVVTACLQSAGIPAFDEACARAKRGEDCGVTFAQARVLRLCADVRDALRGAGRVLVGEALKILPDAMPSRPLRLLFALVGATAGIPRGVFAYQLQGSLGTWRGRDSPCTRGRSREVRLPFGKLCRAGNFARYPLRRRARRCARRL